MPHGLKNFFERLVLPAASLALLGAAPPNGAGAPLTLAWHAPQTGHALSASENISRLIHFNANAIILKFVASRGYPMTILEDRSQTIAPDPHQPCFIVKEDNARHYGGDHPVDISTKRRNAEKTIAFDPSGRYGLLPPLMAADPTAGAPPSPAASAGACPPPANPPAAEAQRYSDAGDAALAEFPARALVAGDSWSFSRPVRVDRDLASGTMTYTDRLDRVEERAGHRIAIITVQGAGRIDPTKELQQKGFKTADLILSGNAEFDCTAGLPLAQHYTSHVEWGTRVLAAHIGLVVDETYNAKPWSNRQS